MLTTTHTLTQLEAEQIKAALLDAARNGQPCHAGAAESLIAAFAAVDVATKLERRS